MCIVYILNFSLNVRNYYNPRPVKDGVIEQKENKDSTVLKLDTVNTREYEFLQFDI